MPGLRVITLEQSQSFSRLSGDRNPLHVDPVAARRLQFGGCVVHGVHLTLLVVEAALRERPNRSVQIASLSVQYDSALRSGEAFEISIEAWTDDVCRAAVMSAGKTIQRVTLRLAERARVETVIGSSFPDAEQCQENAIDDIDGAAGSVALTFDKELAEHLFPIGAARLPRAQIATLLASTLIVGMRLPGLHSVYAGLSLAFDEASSATELQYRVSKADRRFNLITIDLSECGVSGTITALVRATPAKPAVYATLKDQVPPVFSGRRVLVVGGSRGIGEATAKIAAAGGGDVTITYASGRADAEKVVEDIRAGGGMCSLVSLDVRGDLASQLGSVFTDRTPDDLFYFASPTIDVSKHPAWRPQLFARFADYYVNAFGALVDLVVSMRPAGAKGLAVFYPSTAFLDRPPSGSLEYCAAKAAGEAVCSGWEATRPGMKVVSPRIPRLLTDQTVALRSTALPTPADYMLKAVADWRAGCE